MRTTTSVLLVGGALAIIAGCTVKDVDVPALAGPSTFAHSIVLQADRDTLTQNGVDFTDIRITSLGPAGQSENIPLRAQVFVDGLAQDFGTLSTKSPITPTTIRYTAPPASTLAAAQVPATVTIAVTPTMSGDFRGEMARQIDIRLLPQGVILPTNPNLVANFTITPASPMAFETATLDASTTTNNGAACLQACSYSWNFGDGTTGTGRTLTHQFRTVGNVVVTLTVTDGRGAQATRTTTVVVRTPTPPDALFDITPTAPGVGQDVFFTAQRTVPASGRTIVSYDWNFGDGTTGSGVTTSHRYTAQGTYTVVLKVTDDVGAIDTVQDTVVVSEGRPTVTMTILPTSPRVGQPVTVNITATPVGASNIVSYKIAWGDGSPEETVSNPTQSHTYGAPGTVVVAVTAVDSIGRFRTITQSVTITP